MPIQKLRIVSDGLNYTTKVYDAESGEEIIVRSVRLQPICYGEADDITALIELPVSEMTVSKKRG